MSLRITKEVEECPFCFMQKNIDMECGVCGLDVVNKYAPNPNRNDGGFVYLGSTDPISAIEKNLKILGENIENVGLFISICGGMSWLHYLSKFNTGAIEVFDVNQHVVNYNKMVVDIIKISNSRDEFLQNIFLRDMRHFKKHSGDLTYKNQFSYLLEQADRDIYNNLISLLDECSTKAHDEFLSSFLDSHRIITKHRATINLLPCWDKSLIKPTINDSGVTSLFGSLKDRTIFSCGSLYYGAGWLENEGTYHNVRNKLIEINIGFYHMGIESFLLHRRRARIQSASVLYHTTNFLYSFVDNKNKNKIINNIINSENASCNGTISISLLDTYLGLINLKERGQYYVEENQKNLIPSEITQYLDLHISNPIMKVISIGMSEKLCEIYNIKVNISLSQNEHDITSTTLMLAGHYKDLPYKSAGFDIAIFNNVLSQTNDILDNDFLYTLEKYFIKYSLYKIILIENSEILRVFPSKIYSFDSAQKYLLNEVGLNMWAEIEELSDSAFVITFIKRL